MRHIIEHKGSLAFELRRKDIPKDDDFSKVCFPAWRFPMVIGSRWIECEGLEGRRKKRFTSLCLSSELLERIGYLNTMLIPIELEGWEVFKKGECEPDKCLMHDLFPPESKLPRYECISMQPIGNSGIHRWEGNAVKHRDGDITINNLNIHNGDLFRKTPEYSKGS